MKHIVGLVNLIEIHNGFETVKYTSFIQGKHTGFLKFVTLPLYYVFLSHTAVHSMYICFTKFESREGFTSSISIG